MIRIRRLSVQFGTQPVLESLSLDLKPGKVMALVGESGSGKSMTALAIMGLLPRAARVSGLVQLEESGPNLLGQPLLQAAARRADLAMIFQEPMSSLNPVMRIGKQAIEGLPGSPRQAMEQMRRLFQDVQLPQPGAILRRYPHQLSGGQLQRVMIAMALAKRPRLILADEPTTALDVEVQQEILTLCRALIHTEQAERAMLFISHDLNLVAQLADEIAVLYQGKLVEQGPAARLLSQPTHPYTQGLLHARPRPASRPYRLQTVADFGQPEAQPQPRADLNARTNPAELLRIEGLHKAYGPVAALHDLCLTIHAGETLGLVGRSGCGKSTLARILVGLEAASAGGLYWQGQPVARPRPQYVQMIFQDPSGSLNPRMKVGAALMEVQRVHQRCGRAQAQAQARACQLLEQVGLPAEVFQRYPHQLSGGQCQRVGIARALALQPRLLICDESVAALDVSVQAQVLNLLNELKVACNLSLLFISHDLAVVHYMSDRIAVMDGGRIVELQAADALLARPQAPLTRRLLAHAFASR